MHTFDVDDDSHDSRKIKRNIQEIKHNIDRLFNNLEVFYEDTNRVREECIDIAEEEQNINELFTIHESALGEAF